MAVPTGVEIETFLHYILGAAAAYRILIGRTWILPAATELKAPRHRKGRFRPPQSIGMSGARRW
jgi:hypothetical protein